MMDGPHAYREADERTVRLEQYEGALIEKIFAYSFEDYILNEGCTFLPLATKNFSFALL